MDKKLNLSPTTKIRVTSLVPDFMHIQAFNQDRTVAGTMVINVKEIVKVYLSPANPEWTEITLNSGSGIERIICKNNIETFVSKLCVSPIIITDVDDKKETIPEKGNPGSEVGHQTPGIPPTLGKTGKGKGRKAKVKKPTTQGQIQE